MVAFLYKHGLVILIALLVFTADQFSKLGIEFYLPMYSSWPEEGFFRFTHVANTGSAFGLFGGNNMPLTIASIIGIVVLVLFYRSQGTPGVWVQTSLGLMFAGAFGNLADRIRLGHVTDFIDVGPWYIFNLAGRLHRHRHHHLRRRPPADPADAPTHARHNEYPRRRGVRRLGKGASDA